MHQADANPRRHHPRPPRCGKTGQGHHTEAREQHLVDEHPAVVDQQRRNREKPACHQGRHMAEGPPPAPRHEHEQNPGNGRHQPQAQRGHVAPTILPTQLAHRNRQITQQRPMEMHRIKTRHRAIHHPVGDQTRPGRLVGMHRTLPQALQPQAHRQRGDEDPSENDDGALHPVPPCDERTRHPAMFIRAPR